METLEKILLGLWNAALFIVLSLLFVPAFLIVTFLEKTWSEKMKDVLGL